MNLMSASLIAAILAGVTLVATRGISQDFSAQAGNIGFVVGIDTYPSATASPLKKASKDARDVAKELRALGYSFGSRNQFLFEANETNTRSILAGLSELGR